MANKQAVSKPKAKRITKTEAHALLMQVATGLNMLVQESAAGSKSAKGYLWQLAGHLGENGTLADLSTAWSAIQEYCPEMVAAK